MKRGLTKSPGLYGYAGEVLRIDLSTKEIVRTSTSKEYMKKFLGGAGIAAKILYDEVPPEVKPFDPENRVIFGTGPLTGTLAPSSGRFTVTTRSPLTNIYADSNCGGHWAPELKWAGYDYIIVQGRSSYPVYIWINNDEVAIKDASHLWGKNTWETTKMLEQELKDECIKVTCIGPAGENLSLAACLITDRGRAVGRCGLGSVLGSKNLKAIAVRGTKGVKISNPAQHIKACKGLVDKIKSDPYYSALSDFGTPGWMDGFHAMHVDQYKYAMEDNFYWEDYEAISVEKMTERVWTRSLACFNCPIHCAHWCEVKDGPYAGTKGEGFEWNTYNDFGLTLITTEPTFIAKCNILCNQLGIGVDEVGQSIGFAMALFEKGIISKKDTGGMNIQWGNQEVILKLIEQIAYRKGFGYILSEGTKKAAEKIGRGAEYYSRNIKGMEIIADPRASYDIALSTSVATRGADHLQGMPFINWYPLEYVPQEVRDKFMKDLGRAYKMDPRKPESAPDVTEYYNRQLSVFNCLELCVFITNWVLFYAITVEDIPSLFASTTGMNLSLEELYKAGERLRAIQRAYNARLGIRRKDDIPPDYFFENPVKEGPFLPPSDFVLDRKAYDNILTKFYQLYGYDPKTGIPTRKTLVKLDLQEIADDLADRGILPE